MKIKKTSSRLTLNKRSRMALLVVSFILLASAAYCVPAYTFQWWPFTQQIKTPVNDSSNTEEEKEQQKEQENDDKKEVVEGGSKTNNGTPPSVTTSKRIELTARQEDNGMVIISSKLYGYSSGTCTLTIFNGHPYGRSAEIIFQPEYSTCAGFSVQPSDVGPGPWTITLTVKSGGESASKQTTLELR